VCNLRKALSLTDCRVGFSPSIPADFSILHSKFFLLLCTCALVLFNIALPLQAKYGGGTGEPNDPYLIFEPNHMNAVGADSNDWNKHFKIMADIDLANFKGASFNIIGSYDNPFNGVFDGNGHDICNFTYSSIGTNYIGLFGCIGQGARIKGLGLIDPNVDAGTGGFVGSLTGYSHSGTVTNCYTKGGCVSGSSRIGGMVGLNVGTIRGSSADSSASGSADYVGGLAGYNSGTIISCASSGSVEAEADFVGGLAGYNGGTIVSCASSGSVETDADYVGGLTGYSEWIVFVSCAIGSVSGRHNVGGLVGYNKMVIWSTPSGNIFHCYAAGSVVGDSNEGGLIGINDRGAVFSSFWDTQTSGQEDSDGGIPGTTNEMKDPNTFVDAGWDFVGEFENGPNDDWAEPVGGGYPVLSWRLAELPPLPSFSGGSGEPNNPYLISTADDLSRIGHNSRLMDAHFRLTNDVNMADTTHFIIGNRWYPFAGTFDGGGHLISNFYRYSYAGELCKGLFGVVDGVEARIKNLGLADSYISGGGHQTVGLLVGRLINGTVSGCFAERGRIEVFESDGGGLVGSSIGTISNCYTNVYLTGWYGTGGLVESNAGVIANSYSRGKVEGIQSGGLVSRNSGPVTNSFWDVNSSGEPISAAGTGLTTTEMQTMSTFTNVGWDFVGETASGTEFVWRMCENLVDYPRLAWEFTLGDFVCPDGVEMRDVAILGAQWKQPPAKPSADIAPDDGDGIVDGSDLAALVHNWLAGLDN